MIGRRAASTPLELAAAGLRERFGTVGFGVLLFLRFCGQRFFALRRGGAGGELGCFGQVLSLCVFALIWPLVFPFATFSG